MKTTNIITAALAIALVFGACSKEEAQIESNQHYTSFDLTVSNTIKGFIQKIDYQKQNPMFKSFETIDADSALWYLESTFNYCYGFPNEFYSKFEVDTLGFTLELMADGKVNLSTLADKFSQMIDEVTAVYLNVGFDEKGLSMINLQDAEVGDEEITFSVNVVTGEKGTPPSDPVISGPFGEGDDWWYGETKGKCESFTYDTDAAEQLMLAMNATLPDPENNFHVINPTTISREGGQPNTRRENDPNPPDNLYDYYLFFGTEEIGAVELCLYRNAMNTYYSFLRQLLLVKIRNEEFDPMYSLINVIDMVGKWSFTDEPNRKYFHEGHFNYGIKIHYVAEPDYPIQLD